MSALWLPLNMLAAVYIFMRSFGALNQMTWQTNHGVRVAFILSAVGALAVLCGPVYGYTNPQWSEVLMNLGFAGYLVFCRRDCDRIRGLCK